MGIMINFNRVWCLKDTPSIQQILRRTTSTVSQTTTKCKKVCQEKKVEKVDSVKCRECGHFIGRSAYDYMIKAQKYYAKVNAKRFGLTVVMPTITLLLGVGLFFVRRYNYSFIYGTGGCQSIMLWPYGACEVEV